MTKKRTSHESRKSRPRALASGIPVHCLHDEIVPSRELKLWGEVFQLGGHSGTRKRDYAGAVKITMHLPF